MDDDIDPVRSRTVDLPLGLSHPNAPLRQFEFGLSFLILLENPDHEMVVDAQGWHNGPVESLFIL